MTTLRHGPIKGPPSGDYTPTGLYSFDLPQLLWFQQGEVIPYCSERPSGARRATYSAPSGGEGVGLIPQAEIFNKAKPHNAIYGEEKESQTTQMVEG